jgi:5-formyltetrahydrofolate cyclo-ligase
MRLYNPDNKTDVRKDILARIQKIQREIRHSSSLAIAEKLYSLPQFNEAKTVFLYASFGCEVETPALISHCLMRKIKTGLPKVIKADDRLRFFLIRNLEELSPGCWGIHEPPDDEDRAILPAEADIIIVPGVAFDDNCNRLGHGKGYYDRFLGSLNRKLKPDGHEAKSYFAGLAYEEQIVPSLYCGPYDIKMDAVITEKRIIFRNGS